MKILNIITLSTLTILPIVGCSKKTNEPILQIENESYELNLKKGFVYLVKNRWKKTYYWYKMRFIYTYTTMTNKYAKLNKNWYNISN